MSSVVILPNGETKRVWKNKDGYLICKIKGKNKAIHRVIYEQSFGEIPEGLTINHKDGNKYNNLPDNLEIMTFSENAKHSWENGLASPRRGESHGRSILDDVKILTILTMPRKSKNGRGLGCSNKTLSEVFKVSETRIWAIRSGREWKHIHNVVRNNATNI